MMIRIETMLRRKSESGFTILEVLIALTASLLLMLGLTRAYKLLGDRVTASQSEMELSTKLRGVAIRLRDELRRVTVDPDPPVTQESRNGYIEYYEGPFSDKTTILGDWRDPNQPDYYPSSRYGDFDDYLAFTAQAAPGDAYSGLIPWGVLEAHRFAASPSTWMPPTGFDPARRVPFYSDVAEIAYWVSPRWTRRRQLNQFDGTLDYEVSSGYPLSPDADRDLLPDRMDLHRRVLLVRPDLNMTPALMNVYNQIRNVGNTFTPFPPTANVKTLPFMTLSNQGWLIIPLTTTGGNANYFAGTATPTAPGDWSSGVNTISPNWLCGVARMQQVMDLSVSRVADDWNQPATPRYGTPSSIVQANSLSDLSVSDRRFAHIRMPEFLLSGGNGSTMPQLALSPPHPYLMAREGIFPNQAHHTVSTAAPSPFPYGRFTLLGNLRPEFNLSDRMTDANGGGSSTVSINRGGGDVIATDVLGFDVKAFDPAAPKYVWMGQDANSGTPSNDDGDAVLAFDGDELGLPGTDDEIVTLSDIRLNEVLFDSDFNIVGGAGSPGPFQLVDRGDFVDLNYARSPGGAMRGVYHSNGTSIRTIPFYRLDELASPFSGVELSLNRTTGALQLGFPVSWQKSGRFVINRGGVNTVASFFQPTYDSWTTAYSDDEFDQEGRATPEGTFRFGTVPTSFLANALEPFNPPIIPPGPSLFSGVPVSYRNWSNLPGVVGDEGGFSGQNAGQQDRFSARVSPNNYPLTLSAPIPVPLRAIKVTLRVFDIPAAQIRQQSVIQDF